MTDLKQEARTLTLGERMVLAARLAVLEHLRQSVTAVPPVCDSIKSPVQLNRSSTALVGAS